MPIFLALIITLAVPSMGDVRVCKVGCSFNSVQDAIDSAKPEEAIIIESDNYVENISVDKPLILRGLDTGSGRPVLSGNIELTAGVAILRGFDIAGQDGEGCKFSIFGSAGIFLNSFHYSASEQYKICSTDANLWNSSELISYQYESRVLRSRLGNFWQDYEGKDENRDGIGDEPKIIDNRNVDYYPLMQPPENYKIKGEKDVRIKTVQSRLMESFTIPLKTNPTTGYKWFVDYDYDLLDLSFENSSGFSTFIFTPRKLGETSISFIYRKPWENIVADTRIFHVVIST
ncbi:MAG: protease inhibitor I42 family protein [Methanotrichaceae archaeon]|nr:protease inhibitor I42 family protein [Methanotrichaceae archaeon]